MTELEITLNIKLSYSDAEYEITVESTSPESHKATQDKLPYIFRGANNSNQMIRAIDITKDISKLTEYVIQKIIIAKNEKA